MRAPLPLMLATLAALATVGSLACRPPPDAGDAPGEGQTSASPEHAASTGATTPERARPPGAIFRSELTRATQGGSPAYLLNQLGPEPYRPQGRFEGWVITRVWPGDPDLCAAGCGLSPGDIIMTVNGSTLETPESLSALLERIEEAETLELTGIRDGQFFERSHPIVADEPPPG